MKKVLLLTNSEAPAFVAIKDNVMPLAKERGWAVHVFSVGSLGVSAPALIRAWSPDGCLVYAARPYGLRGNFGAWHSAIVTMNAPHPVRGVTSIVHDSGGTGVLAAHELTSLGLDNFAFFSNTPNLPWSNGRQKSFCRELNRRGRKVARYTDGPVGDWLASLPKPCGIFAANDLMAELITSEAFARGIAIPNDIMLLGCDDNPQICEHAEVSISSIRLDAPRCAALAVNALERIMDGKPYAGETIYGDIGITRRASTRAIAGHPPQIAAVLEYIRLNAFSGITTTDVLKQFSGSRRSMEYRFRKATGRSILEEIQAVRLAEVERLLANPMVQISSIASRTGYTSESFISHLFKQSYGMSMRDWRAQNRVR